MLKILKSGKYSLSLMETVLRADMQSVVQQASEFMTACYNVTQATSMAECRIRTWTTRMGRKLATSTTKLCSLPPTIEAFSETVKKAHCQCCVWRRALQDPPNLNPTDYGWVKEDTNSLQPVTLPSPFNKPAPDYILKLVRWFCSSDSLYSFSKAVMQPD